MCQFTFRMEQGFIHQKFRTVHQHWLGYSPDGIVTVGGQQLIEIKSPTCGKNISTELFNKKNVKYLTMRGQNPTLKKRH